MTATVELIDPSKINPNPDNPRLIFRLQELEELEKSIEVQGILVPLTLYADKSKYILLDGERRWRCARKLGLHRVPAIVQPKPERLQNIMMMFAIHNARRDWDPLPTAMKLHQLENELTRAHGRKLTEAELAASASLSRGAVRRYRKILRIPKDIQKMLLKELKELPEKQRITVDHVIEAVDAAENLVAADIVPPDQKRQLIDVITDKFRKEVIKNTVEPRKLGAIARFVKGGQVTLPQARRAIQRFMGRANMTVSEVAAETIEDVEQQKTLDRGLRSFEERWLAKLEASPNLIPEFRIQIEDLIARLKALL